MPPDTMVRLGGEALSGPVFGSDLAYADVIENFFRWQHQTLAGTEVVGRVECQVLVSKPGGGDTSAYSMVRSWIDPDRAVTLKVEKFGPGGQPVLRIDTTKVAKDDEGRSVPATMVARRAGSGTTTEIDGSRIRHDVGLTDADFETEALTDFRVPR